MAKLMVAADGVRSTIRSQQKHLGLKPAEETCMRIWRGHVYVHDIPQTRDEQCEADRTLIQFLLPNGYAPFMIRDGLTYMFVFNHDAKIPGLMLFQIGTPLLEDDNGDDQDLEAIFQAVSSEKRAVWQALLRQTRVIQCTKPCTINMDVIGEKAEDRQGWGGSRRITLIGDAAHACRPTDGQGANMAFEDACVSSDYFNSNPKARTSTISLGPFWMILATLFWTLKILGDRG
jgi:2-polyprenyl-6-methoxyphenol hydroxylase-like FAD-dependent oxidoreductase